jgi:aspartate/methionine/tyrosine aminotransferase
MRKPRGSLISYFSRMASQKGYINLAQGKPGFPPPHELLQILKELSDSASLHQYAPGNGNTKLLSLLAERYSRLVPISARHLLVVQGATEGIFLTLFYLNTILKSPYSVLSFNPVYESYPRLSEFLNLPFEYLDYNPDLSVDFDQLKKIIMERRVKIVFIASPGNPLGKIWKAAEIHKIIALSERLDFYIIFDAVYQEIYFSKPPYNPLSCKSIPRLHHRLFYVNSFSKMLSITGWRIGYIISQSEQMSRIRAIHDYTGLCAPALFQEAILQYLRRFEYGRTYLRTIREKCRQSYLFLKQVLENNNFHVPDTQGGYFLWAKLPEQFSDGFRFALDLVRKNRVGVVPGENFSPSQSRNIRCNIAADLPIIREGAQRIEAFIKSNPR